MRADHAFQASLSIGGLAFLIFLGAVAAHAAAVPSVSTRAFAGAAPAGRFEWDGRTERGEPAPAGVYLVRLMSGGEHAVRTAALLR